MRLILALTGLLCCVHAAGEEVQIRVDDLTRSYVVQAPEDVSGAPGLVVLHGGGGTPERVRRTTGFGLAARGWYELYPTGLDRAWNDGRRALSGGPLRSTDDVGFFSAMIDRETETGRLDPDRVFVVGLSNGGAMAQRLVCQMPDRIARAAVVIMNFPVGLDCPSGRPVPVVFVLGTEDPVVPYDGGAITLDRKDRGGVMPTPDTLAFFARRNDCSGVERMDLPDRDPDDGTRVFLLHYTGCTKMLQAFIVSGGGHTWPGATSARMLERLLGRTSRDISATDLIEEFFLELATP